MKPKINEGNFYKSINQTISENRHIDYLKEVIKKYEEYKKTFDNVFTDNILNKFRSYQSLNRIFA